MMTIALAVTTFTGQNAGARNLSRIKEGHKVALKMAEIGTLILALPALCFAPEIVRIFNTDPDVVIMAPFSSERTVGSLSLPA